MKPPASALGLRQVGYFPETPDGHSRVSSNDVDVDDRGLHILERA